MSLVSLAMGNCGTPSASPVAVGNLPLATPVKRAMAYRLLRAVRNKGNSALQDGRQGHPSKLRGEVRVFLEASYREVPRTPSSSLQAALQGRFGLQVSVSQINRVLAALGVSNPSKTSRQGKNSKSRDDFVAPRVARRCRESSVTCCRS